jgi:hypothetical protein
MVNTMPLSSPELQGRLTIKAILPKLNKKIAEELRQKARALNLKLAVEFRRDRSENSRYCQCGEPLKKHQRLCSECDLYRPRPNRGRLVPIDCVWPLGRRQESSWEAEDRLGRDFSDYEKWVEEHEYKPAIIGIRNQTTRDIEDLRAAHEDLAEVYGADGWRKIKFEIDHSRITGPMHTDLADSGKSQDEIDPGDYERQQSKAEEYGKE